MTPYQIDILLWYRCRAEDHPQVTKPAPIFAETMAGFIQDELIIKQGPQFNPAMTYMLSDRGQAYCDALCQVPLPVHQWITPWPKRELTADLWSDFRELGKALGI